MYERQAPLFAEFADKSYTWQVLERKVYCDCLRSLCAPTACTLDLGCGNGRIPRLIEQMGVTQERIHGVDTNEALLAMARSQQPKATFRRHDIRSRGPVAGAFDVVTAHMVLHAFDNAELAAALRCAYDCMSPGARLFYMVTHPNRQKEFTSLPPEARMWILVQSPWDTEVWNFHRPLADYVSLTEAAGFRIESVDELSLPKSAEAVAPARYAKHTSFGAVRLAIQAWK